MISPKTEHDLAEAVADASAPLRITGGGTRDIGKPVTGEVLSVAALSGVTLYEPGALTLVAKAGTPLAEVEEVLAAENQRLAFEPMDHRALLGTEGVPTIGGVVAGNISGPRRVQAGACRDYLLGVRFVDGRGAVIKNGGRVMKNVTGYDLVKLMAGSWGTLGVLSEVSFKVLPTPSSTATLVFSGVGWDASSGIMTAALGSPFQVTGAGHLPAGALGKYGAVVIRLEGFETSVSYRTDALRRLLSDRFGAPDRVVTDPDENTSIWRALRDATCFAGNGKDIWRASIKPTDCTRLADRFTQEEVALDWGGGLVWLSMQPGTDARERLAGIPGHATLVKASHATRMTLPVFQPEPPPLAVISAGLRDKFDPRGILNPGLMG